MVGVGGVTKVLGVGVELGGVWGLMAVLMEVKAAVGAEDLRRCSKLF